MRVLIAVLVLALAVTVSAQNTSCLATDPFIDMTRTTATGGNLTVVFATSQAFTTTTLDFLNTDATNGFQCRMSAANNIWQRLPTTGCITYWMITGAINTMINNCGFIPDETVTSVTTFRATISITTVRPSTVSFRGTLNETRNTAAVLGVQFPTSVSVSATASIFGVSTQQAVVSTQTFSPNNYTAVVGLITTIQYPYQLKFPTASFPGYVISVAPGVVDFYNNTASACNVTGTDTFSAGTFCTQLWLVSITPNNPCSGTNFINVTDLGISFQTQCLFNTSSCTPPSGFNATVTFSTLTSNFCPTPVLFNAGTISLNISLASFSNAALTTSQSQFVFGSRVFYRAIITSMIQISDARIEAVRIFAGGSAGVSALYLNTFTNASNFFNGAGKAGTFQTVPARPAVDFSAAPTLLVINDAAFGAAFSKSVSFNFVWSNETSGATGDNPTAATVGVTVRVRYANVSTVGNGPTEALLTVFQKLTGARMMDEPTLAAISTASVSAVTAPSTGSSSSSATVAGMPVAAVAAVAAVFGVAFVAFIAAVVYRNKRANANRTVKGIESVQLQTPAATPSPATTA